MKHIFLYNPLAGKGKAEKFINEAKKKFGDDLSLHDITKIDNFPDFFAAIAPNDHIIVCGGDGTLNRFLNSAKNISQTLTYCPAGSGNDFMNDLNRTPEDGAFEINQYIKNLPSVKVGENIYRFVNGVGFGVDGYVCAEGNRLRDKQKKVNYTGIALKGLLFAFKPVNATVVVDGKEYKYKKVWMTTTMKGRFFGGGMRVEPDEKNDYIKGRPNLVHGPHSPFITQPKRLYVSGQAVCGARGCTRACMMSLEARGVIKNQFKKPFRRHRPWQVDWSEDGNIKYLTEDLTKMVEADEHEAD